MPEELVTVAVFEGEARAVAAAARLEAEGIEAYVSREGLGGIPIRHGRVFGNQVQVRADDADRARELLGQSPDYHEG